MKALADRGFAQAVLPPHERPDVARAARARLRRRRRRRCIARAARDAPQLLAACSSAAAMWVANAATVSPSADTADGRVHFTPANLRLAFPPRARSADDHARAARDLRRRGAASPCTIRCPRRRSSATKARRTTRGSPPTPARRGIELFVYGRAALRRGGARRRSAFRRGRRAKLAKRSRAATVSIRRARMFAQQNPDGDRRRRVPQRRDRRRQRRACSSVTSARIVDAGRACSRRSRERVGPAFTPIVVRDDGGEPRARGRDLSLQQPAARRAPTAACCSSRRRNAAEDAAVAAYLDAPRRRRAARFAKSLTFDLQQSMRNGGGPACLRLRVALTAAERAAIRAASGSTTRCTPSWSPGSSGIIATGSRPPISPTRRCSTNAGARSTSSAACCGSAASIRFNSAAQDATRARREVGSSLRPRSR